MKSKIESEYEGVLEEWIVKEVYMKVSFSREKILKRR